MNIPVMPDTVSRILTKARAEIPVVDEKFVRETYREFSGPC